MGMPTSRLIAVLLIAATVPLFAAEDRAELATRFQRLDRNGDGKLSAEEAKPLPALSRLFTFADADRDGMLTIGEIRAPAQAADAKQRTRRRKGGWMRIVAITAV